MIQHLAQTIAAGAVRIGAPFLIVFFGYIWMARAEPAAKDSQESVPFTHVADLDGHVGFEASPFSGDGSRVVARQGDDQLIRVWDLDSFKPIGKPLKHDHCIWRQLSAEGKTLFTAGNNDVCLWDIQTSQLGSVTHVDGDLVFASFGPDGTRFLTQDGGDITSLQLWKTGEGRPFAKLSHSGGVTFATFDNSGRRIMTREWKVGAEFHLWDAKTGLEECQPIHSDFDSQGDFDPLAAFDADGKRVAIARLHGFTLADGETGKILSTGEFEGNIETRAIVLSADGKTVAVVTESTLDRGETGPVKVFDAATGKLLRTLAAGTVRCAMGPNGKYLLCSKIQPHPAELWDLSDGSKVQTFMEMSGTIAFSPSGDTIAITCGDKTTIWRAKENERPKGPAGGG